ncbi:MAG: ATP-dependent helicase [Eubacteriales bacterium]
MDERFLQKLNVHQKQAVLDDSHCALVNAVVGSGKTTVLTAKVLYLRHRQVPLTEMAVITFTNKAADEIRERLNGNTMPWMGTFHSVAMRLLQTALPVDTLGYTPSFTVMDPDELLEAAIGLIAQKKLSIKYTNKLPQRLESYRAGNSLFGVMKTPDDIGRLWELLQQEKHRQNRMDFDDLLSNASRLLAAKPGFIKWVIVDEFQDCDDLQLSFIRSLSGPDTQLFVVGDPSQSIYTWRGGKPRIFSEFKKEFLAVEYSLPLNYRSSGTILSAAKQFLHPDTDLSGVREPGSKIVIQSHYNAFMEADALADKILRLHAQGIPLGSISVFYRLQKQSVILEEIFRRKGVPYQNSVHKSLKDMPVLLWLTRLLKASVNPDDIGSRTATLTDARYGPGLTPAQVKKITVGSCELYDLIKGFPAWAQTGGSAEGIYAYFGLDERLSPTSASFLKDKHLALQFLSKINQTVQNHSELLIGCAAFINESSLYCTDLPDQSDCGDCVHLMTLHACKGLEFRVVFIIGVNYGLIPLIRTNSQDEEEEKRLFFVGITRAMDTLELSYYTDPEPRVMPGESPYLSVLPEHLVERVSKAHSSVNVQVIRHAVMDNRANAANQPAKMPPAENNLKVRHPKYGLGRLVSEDNDMFTVLFEDYGEKKLARQFCQLEFL